MCPWDADSPAWLLMQFYVLILRLYSEVKREMNPLLRCRVHPRSQPLGNFLSFLEASIVFEGMGRPRGFRRLRKTHLENILPRGS